MMGKRHVRPHGQRTYVLCALLFAAQIGSAGCAQDTRGLGFANLQIYSVSSPRLASNQPESACSTTCIAARRGAWGGRRRAGLLRTLQPLHTMHMGEEGERVRSCGDEDENLVEKYRKILNNAEETTKAAEAPTGFFSNFLAATKVKPCETDYDCNPVSMAVFAWLLLRGGHSLSTSTCARY